MSTPYSQRPALTTRFGAVPRLTPPGVAPTDDALGAARNTVLRAAAERGARAGLWLSGLASRRPGSELGDALDGMAEAVTFVLMAYGRRLTGLSADERTVLLSHLDPHLSPAGSIVAPRRGQHLGIGDLSAAIALTSAVRTAFAMAAADWAENLPSLLAVIDHVLDQADAPPITGRE
ncbi:hypothetical protein AB0D08_21195 [Kitasatospora sp. NPDC048540]|uniref:hypothetical protein n=1 Tax=Kitasatospora sp. NPDC048540 TaxID=3155634 RepID=UPI0033F919C1